MPKGDNERGDGFVPNKHVKVGKVGAIKAPSVSKPSTQSAGTSGEPRDDVRLHNQYNVSASDTRKKSGEAKLPLETASSAKIANGILSASVIESKHTEKQRAGVMHLKNASGNLKDPSGSSDALHNRLHEKVASTQHSGRPFNNTDESDASKRTKERSTVREVPDLNMPDGRNASETSVSSSLLPLLLSDVDGQQLPEKWMFIFMAFKKKNAGLTTFDRGAATYYQM